MAHVFRRFLATASVPILALTLGACAKTEADPRLEAPLVRTQQADASIATSRNYTGIVSARVQSNLGFRVPGKVVARLVDTGQTVRAGQPLMRIDRTDLQLADAAATQTVEAARAQAVQTQADEKRFRGLVSVGAVSASAYDQAKAAAEAATARLKAAEAQARVSANESGYAVLTADADGTVVDTQAEPGQVVTAGQVVVRLAHAGPREAVVDLPETVRPPVGSEAEASVFGDATHPGKARLRQLSDAADPVTRTFEARYVLEGEAALAPLGTTVVVRLPEQGTGGIDVPLGALIDTGKGPGVWVVTKESTVTWRAVTLTAIGDESGSISAGLAPGERFVALGAHQLHEGQKVRLSEQPSASAPTPHIAAAGPGAVAGAMR